MTREVAVAVGVAVEVEVLVEAKASVVYQATFLAGQKRAPSAPVFIYCATCARSRRPITSIKSQPSRNGMTSSLKKNLQRIVSKPISDR